MKRTLISIGVLVTVGILVFLPVMIYGGFTVQTVEGTLTFESSTTSLMTRDSTNQYTGPSILDWNIDLHNSSENAWSYAFSGFGGRNDVEGPPAIEIPIFDISLELKIIFNLTKNGETVQLIDIGISSGEGLHEVDIVLGPGEGITESGLYELYIILSLELSTPLGDYSADVVLGPIPINVVLE